MIIADSKCIGGAGKLVNEAAVNQIEAIDCELSIYRKGCISIHVDIKNNYVTWRESKQWCNNFTKTIPTKAVDELISFMRSSSLLNDILENHSLLNDFSDSYCERKLAADKNTTSLTENKSDISKQNIGQLSESAQSRDCLIPSSIPGERLISQDKQQYDDIGWYQNVDQNKSSWQIVMVFGNFNFTRNGRFPLPKGWIEFQRVIEKVSRAPFRLF